ncbi:MAG: discoidin domain-containing protein [Frankiaceae bacterium]|nr:discoidin domain-containing protein [Arenimonas sp.]
MACALLAAADAAAGAAATAAVPVQASAPRTIDDFESVAGWTTFASDQVKIGIRQGEGSAGKSLCMDYDFNGVSGYAVARRKLPMDYPANYEYSIRLRGAAPANNLEFKLPDASGENVWWVTRPNYLPSSEWTQLKLKKRHISFAWGPTTDKTLRHTDAFEITVSAGKGGGKGFLCFDDLQFRELPAEGATLPTLKAGATSAAVNAGAALAVDGDADTAWQARAGTQQLTLDLGVSREFGGLVLRWRKGEQASDYRIAVSDDAKQWRDVRRVQAGNGDIDLIALPESEARYVRLSLDKAVSAKYALQEISVEPLEFAATPNDFLRAVALRSPRGHFPRGFSGDQSYWTLVGTDGGSESGLLGEDGAIESAKGGFSVEPFIINDGHLISWADVRSTQSLADGYLPVPSASWEHPIAQLKVPAFAQGDKASSQLIARYNLRNPTRAPLDYVLALAIRPMQVNPPTQFLNTIGGMSPIHALGFDGPVATVDGKPRVFALQVPTRVFATTFDAGMVEEHLQGETVPQAGFVRDDTGLASGAMLFHLHLDAGESREVGVWLPLSGDTRAPLPDFDAAVAQAAVEEQWREKLGQVGLKVPAQGQVLVDTLRTALAQMLISRSGPRLQPGTRSYARAWIRDGAMISEGLLRMGRGDVAEDFLRWYAPFQFSNGKVPCCVDDRGSDPVPENDSQGELVYTVAELYRYGGDKALLAAMWPHVQGAVRYMDELRASERKSDPLALRNPAFYGLMPASISHEGYSAKPMHSYWDDFWALRGYKDAVEIAQWLGHDAEAIAFATSRDEFRTDLYQSIATATRQHGIDFIPGAAELGDFDATSTTIALAPGGEQGRLPDTLLRNTFERYWKEFVERRDGKREWQYYTPYELRTVGAFVRLGWRDRAHELLDFFIQDRQPQGWNQWAEVEAREPRKPFFLGDLPHAWVASDYVRSVLDMFAYERESDQSLVIAAGIPDPWLDGEGIAVSKLRTPHGLLSYTLRREKGVLLLRIDAGLVVPEGGIVLRTAKKESRVRKLPATLRIKG